MVFLPRLLHELHAGAPAPAAAAPAPAARCPTSPAPPASRGDEQMKHAVVEGRIGRPAPQRAHWGARDCRRRASFAPATLRDRERYAGGDGVDARRQKTVGFAHHAIGFVQHCRDAQQRGGEQRRHGGIAAKADDDARLQLAQGFQRLQGPEAERENRAAFASGEPPRGVAARIVCMARAGKVPP